MESQKVLAEQKLQVVDDMIMQNKGFTLMEVMVALAVITIGLLGIAGMQLFSLKTNHDAYLRTQAGFIAYSLIDKMRANRDEALAGSYNIDIDDGPSIGTNCYSANCGSSSLAQFDLNLWKCELGKFSDDAICSTALSVTPILPNGDGSVALSGNEITVTVQWQDSLNRDATTTTPRSLQVVAFL